MSFLSSFRKLFRLGGEDAKKKEANKNIRRDIDPTQLWEVIGELGDGAFGKVYKDLTVSQKANVIYEDESQKRHFHMKELVGEKME